MRRNMRASNSRISYLNGYELSDFSTRKCARGPETFSF